MRIAESLLVTLRHPKLDITVPETILRACSPVLDGILRDAAVPEGDGNKILTIDDVEPDVLKMFVHVVTMNSYAPTDASLTTIGIAENAALLMPLIHKYDCKGLLARVQEAVNAKPLGPSIVAMCRYDMDPKWMAKETMDCAAKHLFGSTQKPGHDEMIEKYRRGLDGLSPAFVKDLLIHVLSDAELGTGSYIQGTVMKGLKFIPV